MDTRSIFLIMLPAFAECLVLVGIHSYLGLHVIRRKVIFVDLAFAQIAALGTLIAFLFGIPPHTLGAYVFALLLTAAGAAVFSLCRFRRSRIPQEAIIGLVYALAAAAAILLIDKAPHGAEHLKEILTGSILWVRWEAVATAAIVYAAVGLFHYRFRKTFLLISDDPESAWESGRNVRLWDFLFYLSFGIVITLSVDVAGVLIVFVFLVAPAILAMTLTDRLGAQLLLGWGMGVVVTTLGLAFAYVGDLPTGPAVITTYGIALVAVAAGAYIARAPRRATAVRNAGLVTLVGGLAVAGLWLLGTVLGGAYRVEGISHPTIEDPVVSDDPMAQADAVVQALGSDPTTGVARAIEYLLGEPLPFFRERVLERLTELMGKDPGVVAEEGMDSLANQRALQRVRDHFGLE